MKELAKDYLGFSVSTGSTGSGFGDGAGTSGLLSGLTGGIGVIGSGVTSLELFSGSLGTMSGASGASGQEQVHQD